MRRCLLAAALASCKFDDGTAFIVHDAAADSAPDTTPADAAATTGTLFVADFTAQKLFRYAISVNPAAPPAPVVTTVTNGLSPVLVPATQELWVGENATSTIARFKTPFGTPTPNGMITGNGLTNSFGKAVMVDSEVWIVNAQSSAAVDRLQLDGSGNASTAGSVGTVINGRGIVFDHVTRDLYVTECCGTNTILHYAVAANRTTTQKPSFDAGAAGALNPHGMWIMPWGELFVADAGTSKIFRFKRDGSGTLSANGTITGGGLATPIDLALAPWGELYVANQTGGVVSRFVFDGSHNATPNGTFTIPGTQTTAWIALQ